MGASVIIATLTIRQLDDAQFTVSMEVDRNTAHTSGEQMLAGLIDKAVGAGLSATMEYLQKHNDADSVMGVSRDGLDKAIKQAVDLSLMDKE
jgi:hypothetical protein